MNVPLESKIKPLRQNTSYVKPLPSVGQWQVYKNLDRIAKNPLPFHHENFVKLGDTFRITPGFSTEVVFTRKPEIIKHILKKNHRNYDKSNLQTKELAKYIGHGLLTANGDFWRTHRRMIQPAFHKKKLEGLLSTMYDAIDKALSPFSSSKEEDVFPIMGDLAFQVVAQSLFSADDIGEQMNALQNITTRNQKMLIKEMRRPYLNWWYWANGAVGRHLKYAEQGRTLLNDIIQERIDSGLEKDDLLDMLLKARYEDGSPLSRKQLIDEVLILFTAGHETTANTLSFTLFLLAKHPKVQEKLFAEVEMLDFDKANLLETFSQLTYTKQCIEEGMRLYPPVYIIDRVSRAEDVIEGHAFKKRTLWLMSMYELHRHPEFWENPNDFQPERFDSANKKDYTDFYFPFGAGPRMCIGNSFAMYEMMMVVAKLVQKYRLGTLMNEVALRPLISLKPESVVLQLQAR